MHRISMFSSLFAVVVLLACGVVNAEPGKIDPIYRFDPTLSLAGGSAPSISANPEKPLDTAENHEGSGRVRLETQTPVAPYIDAERAPELSPEEQRLLTESNKDKDLRDYSLEAGVGVKVEDTTSLNLGYRFNNPPSIMNERNNDPLNMQGDLRISLDIKVPF